MTDSDVFVLLQSGLFSAILTAFLIESYKILQADAGDTTVALLSHISFQLSSASIGTASTIDIPPPFQSTAAAMLCNALWFLSLALSLTCALLATLVEQWAREFLHKTEIHPAPVRRARVFSFLQFGLKQFHMRAVVDIIPSLLHLSLFFFFGGLVAFLLPVNRILTYLMGIILGGFLVLYIVFTVLPVFLQACPYRTPLSAVLWWLKQYFGRPLGSLKHKSMRHMNQAMSDEALNQSQDRDRHAVQWTMASLTDDNELLPFVEAIPDVIYGPKGFHHVNDHLFLSIIEAVDPQQSLGVRIVNLLSSSDNLPLDDAVRTRRQTACMKAIWALSMSNAKANRPAIPFERSTLAALRVKSLDAYYYAPSAQAALRNSWLHTLQCLIKSIHESLESYDFRLAPEVQKDALHVMDTLTGGLTTTTGDIFIGHTFFIKEDDETFIEDIKTLKIARPIPVDRQQIGLACDPVPVIKNQKEASGRLMRSRSWGIARVLILTEFLLSSLRISRNTEQLPYEFYTTCREILPDIANVTPTGLAEVGRLFLSLPDPSQIAKMTSSIHAIDKIIGVSLKLLPFIPSDSMTSIYQYIAHRDSDAAIVHIGRAAHMPLFGSYIVKDLMVQTDFPDDGFDAICILLSLQHPLWQKDDFSEWVERLCPALVHRRFSSAMAILSIHILSHHISILQKLRNSDPITADEELQRVHKHPLMISHFPADIPEALSIKEKCAVVLDQQMEIRIIMLAQLLHKYTGVSPPYRGVAAANSLVNQALWRFKGPVRAESQHALAKGVRIIVQRLKQQPDDPGLREIIDNKLLWLSETWEWIDDYTSASILAGAIDMYLSTAGSDNGTGIAAPAVQNANNLRVRCRQILGDRFIMEASGATPSPPAFNSNLSFPDPQIPLEEAFPYTPESEDEFPMTVEMVDDSVGPQFGADLEITVP